MATFTVDNAAELVEAYGDATSTDVGSRDIIRMTANEFSAANANTYILTHRSNTDVVKAVEFTADDPFNPPLVLDLFLNMRRVSGLRVSRINHRGTTVHASAVDDRGDRIPLQQGALRINAFNGFEVEQCSFDHYRVCAYFQDYNETRDASNLVVRNIDMPRCSMDGIVIRATLRTALFEGWWAGDEANSPTLYTDGSWHTDLLQGGLDAGTGPHQGWTFQNCLWEINRMKGPFVADTDLATTTILDGVLFDNVFLTNGRANGFGFGGVDNLVMRRTILRQHPNGPSTTALNFSRRVGAITLESTVVLNKAPTYTRQDGADPIIVGPIIDNAARHATAIPAGFVTLVRGVNCGVTPPESAVLPPQMVNIATDGRVAATIWDQVQFLPPRYAPTIRFPSASPGHGAGGDPANVQWRRTTAGITDWQPTEAGVPPQSNGGWRYRLSAAGSAGIAGSTVPPETSMDDVTIRYRLGAGLPWSLESAYPSGPGVASPPAPPDGTLAALASGEWGENAVPEVTPGFFGWRFWIATSVGAITAAEWSNNNGATWAPCFAAGLDGSSRTLWQLQPSSAGADDHVVGYGVSRTVRVRYYTDAGMSLISSTSKTFTGPNAPTPALTPGTRLRSSASPLVVGGAVCAVPQSTRPASPARDLYAAVDNGDGTITVTGPIDPPFGADRVCARTTGPRYRLRSEGANAKTVTLPRRGAKFVRIHGVKGRVAGRSLLIELPVGPT
ncbi:MAG: hypothetical protein KAX54_00245 [Thauera sp.]|nr:hypothetical protein [Thauera sp.]